MCLDLLERFQTSLVGVLGFTGVILTMAVNAWTQRNIQAAQREHKVRSLRTALLVELRENVRMYEARISELSNADGNHPALIPSKVISGIYQSSLSDIGLLSANEVESVLCAYLLLDEMPYRIRLLVGADNVCGYNDEVIKIDAGMQQDAMRVHQALLPKLQKAVAALGRNA